MLSFRSLWCPSWIWFRPWRTAQVGQGFEFCAQAQALSAEDGLAEFHLVNTVVNHHLQVVDLDDLVPQIGQEGEGQITVYDGALERAFLLGTFYVRVNPLMVQSGIGKEVDTFLVYLQIFRFAQGLPYIFSKSSKELITNLLMFPEI